MDQRTAAIISGSTAVLDGLLHLLVDKGVLSAQEVRSIIEDVVVRGIEDGAQPGFDEVPMLLLRRIEGGKPDPH